MAAEYLLVSDSGMILRGMKPDKKKLETQLTTTKAS